MYKRPLREDEFIGPLSMCPRTFEEDAKAFRDFTATVTGLDKRRKAEKKRREGGDDDGGGKGKKGKGKKKK